MVNEFTHRKSFAAAYMGDDQLLPNGNVFVGWGSQPYFSEYSPSGQLLMDASLPSPDLSYRATLDDWVGLPEFPPKGAARTGAGETTFTPAGTGPPRFRPGRYWQARTTITCRWWPTDRGRGLKRP